MIFICLRFAIQIHCHDNGRRNQLFMFFLKIATVTVFKKAKDKTTRDKTQEE